MIELPVLFLLLQFYTQQQSTYLLSSILFRWSAGPFHIPFLLYYNQTNNRNTSSSSSSTNKFKMQFSLATLVLGLAAIASAGTVDVEGVRNAPRSAVNVRRQNDNRPVPNGACCVANTSLKQDTCTSASGQTGRCVPGGNNCK
jgi:hypothetical protein